MAVYRSEVLVGRDAELEELRATAKGAARGEPGVVLMLGEAGVGKSRLVAEATAELEAAGALVAVSHGVELSGGELPDGGVTELVRDLTRALGVAKVRRLAGTDALTLGAFHPELGRPTGPPERAAVTASLLRLLERIPSTGWCAGCSKTCRGWMPRAATWPPTWRGWPEAGSC